MTTSRSPTVALVRAEAQVAAVRDDPATRLALMARVFRGPTGYAPRHLPFGRAALSFMRWRARRGVLNPLDASPPGSVWWRAINERLPPSRAADRPGSGRAEQAVSRLQRLYEWSAEELAEPCVLELVRDGNPIYAWPYEERDVWRAREMPLAGRVLARVTRPIPRAAPAPTCR